MLVISPQVFAGGDVAVVKILRGSVTLNDIRGNKKILKVNDRVQEGVLIKTDAKSFVQLIFIDKSRMNIGPSSVMRIEQYSGKKAGIVDLVKGKVRSKVTKDYLEISNQDESKLFIKTKNAVMGVRGTDFLITTNGEKTATVLFEGEIVFNKLDGEKNFDHKNLEDIVDRGVRIKPGEFSVVEKELSFPTVPAVINVEQRAKLEKNETFKKSPDRAPSSTPSTKNKVIIPDGLNNEVISQPSKDLESNLSQDHSTSSEQLDDQARREFATGKIDGDKIKPANGSFVHLESGTIIPPSAQSVYDQNTNSFIDSGGNGTVSSDGEFLPPENIQITDRGEMILTVKNENGAVQNIKIELQQPVMNSEAPSLNKVSISLREHPERIPDSGTLSLGGENRPVSLSSETLNSPPSGGIDQNTSVIQRNRGKLNINVIK